MFSTADLIGDFRFLNLRSTEDIEKYEVPIKTVPRPGFNSTGTEVELMINAFPITTYPSRTIYQYDVSTFSSIH
jgi:eukaryotic translation initiation factor 2C